MKRIAGLFISMLLTLMTIVSCDSAQQRAENPFFSEWDTPYGVPPFDKIRPEHYMPAFERGMSLQLAEIDAITSNNDEPTFENVILAYDDSGRMLAQTALVFGMLSEADNSSEMQALQEQAMPLLSAHADRIRLDEKLFEKVKDVMIVVMFWDSMPSRCGCCRRPTTVSCGPVRCSTRNRKSD